MKNTVLETWTIRISCWSCVCMYVRIYYLTLSNFLMINVRSAVLLLDTKIYEAEEEKSSLMLVPLLLFLL